MPLADEYRYMEHLLFSSDFPSLYGFSLLCTSPMTYSCLDESRHITQLFSSPDTGETESTRATGAAGVLLLLSFIYCLGYPAVKAFRRARGDDGGDAGEQQGGSNTAVVAAGDYVA